MIDLNPIKARLDAATPGEWEKGTNSQRKGLQNIVVQNEGATEYVATYLYPDDADLIVHAPADLRALIAEVEELREIVSQYHACSKGICMWCVDHSSRECGPCAKEDTCWCHPARPSWRPIFGAERALNTTTDGGEG